MKKKPETLITPAMRHQYKSTYYRFLNGNSEKKKSLYPFACHKRHLKGGGGCPINEIAKTETVSLRVWHDKDPSIL